MKTLSLNISLTYFFKKRSEIHRVQSSRDEKGIGGKGCLPSHLSSAIRLLFPEAPACVTFLDDSPGCAVHEYNVKALSPSGRGGGSSVAGHLFDGKRRHNSLSKEKKKKTQEDTRPLLRVV